MKREKLEEKVADVLRDADSHSCMYGEGIDEWDLARHVVDYLIGQQLLNGLEGTPE